MYAATAQYDHSFYRYDFSFSSDIVCANSEGPEQSARWQTAQDHRCLHVVFFCTFHSVPAVLQNTDQYKLRT